MRIQFDSEIKVAGIGLVPWTRLGPERWLPRYRIASYYGWDMQHVPGAPAVFALSDGVDPLPKLTKVNTQHLINNADFQHILTDHLADYGLITYKPVDPPEHLESKVRFLEANQYLAQRLENKVEFRKIFKDELPFPAYDIVDRRTIDPDAKGLQKLQKGREAIVVQDETLSGGKGTYVVRRPEDLAQAVKAFDKLNAGTRVVVSDLVAQAYERTVQCCATRFGVFVGPLQKQIVANPLLANLDVAEGDRFCGGEIRRNDPCTDAYPAIKRYATLIGERLISMGYRGIFGVDYLVDANGGVFVLEVNPRITGMTPLLTMLHRDGEDVPFYLLHVLELAGADYKILDHAVNPVPAEGGVAVLHSKSRNTVQIVDSPQSGLYSPDGTFIEKRFRLQTESSEQQMLVQRYTPPHFRIKPGGRLITAFTNQPMLSEEDRLLPEMDSLLASLSARIKLKEVGP